MATVSLSRDDEDSLFDVRFHHAIIEGTSYEVGRLQGEFLKQTGRTVISYEPPEPERTSREMRRLFDQYCPGLNDEIQGAADSLGMSFEKALFCAALGPAAHRCSQAAALPAVTEGGHLYVARSYEMRLGEADLRLCTTRVKGKAAHLGFSEMLSGRNDGINGYGLCVTMSGSWDPVPEDANEPNGLHYAMAIRALLEGCKTLAEALELLERMPIGGGVNIIVAHRSGTAALVEVAGRKRAIKTIDADTADQYLLAINHFTMMGISEHHENSTTRYDAFMSWLRANTGRINADAFKAFLAREYPQGVCGFISEFQLGTLWSMVFDVSEGTVEIRFGPPPHNEWHSFTLGGPVGVSEYKALFPRKKA